MRAGYGATLGWLYQGRAKSEINDEEYTLGVEGRVLSIGSVQNVYGGVAGKGTFSISGGTVAFIWGVAWKNFGVYDKFGVSLLKTEFQGRGFSGNDTAWSIRPTVGFGCYYDLTNNLRVGAEWERLWAAVGDEKQGLQGASIGLVTANVKYRF